LRANDLVLSATTTRRSILAISAIAIDTWRGDRRVFPRSPVILLLWRVRRLGHCRQHANFQFAALVNVSSCPNSTCFDGCSAAVPSEAVSADGESCVRSEPSASHPNPAAGRVENENVFAKILRGDVPCYEVYENLRTFAFLDIMPRSPEHTLIIPKDTGARHPRYTGR
jgi:hypothetical protein